MSNFRRRLMMNIKKKEKYTQLEYIEKNGFTQYIPKQIKISLEGALKQWALLEVTSCDGYAVLKKWSKRSL